VGLGPVARAALPAVMLTALGLASGCATTATVRFSCDRQINEGLLLTVDVVQVDEREAQEILRIGDDWFYSDLRRQLSPRTTTISVETPSDAVAVRACDRTVSVSPRKGYDTLLVIADYKGVGSDSGQRHLELIEKPQWKGGTVRVALRDSYLTVIGGR
jgi:hypothetical protein